MTDKRSIFADLDKVPCKNTRRKAHTFKKKSDRIALKLAPSLLTFALGPALLPFKDILHLHKLFVFVSSRHHCPSSCHRGFQRLFPCIMLGFCNDNKGGGQFPAPVSTLTYNMCSLDLLHCISALCYSWLVSPTPTPESCGCPVARHPELFLSAG